MSVNEFGAVSLLMPTKHLDNVRLIIVKKLALKGIRSAVTGYYLFVAYYGLFKLDFASISHPNWRNLKNHWWKCITVWNVGLQVRYFLISFLIDFEDTLPKTKWTQKLLEIGKRVQDYCFLTLDVPSSVFVCSLFWFIQSLNKALFFPAEMSNWIPDWYNHAVHTNPIFLICFQMFFYFHQNPSIKSALMGLFLHCSTYILCMFYTKWSTGQWIYLVLEEVAENIPQAVVLFSVIGFIFPLLILLSARKLNELIWRKKTN